MFQDSEYVKFLYMEGLSFWIYLNMAKKCLNKLFWLCLGSKYAWSKFHRVLNMSPILNMPGLRIWLVCDYTKVTQCCEYAWTCLNNALNMREFGLIVLNMLEYAIILNVSGAVHSIRSPWKLLRSYRDRGVFRTLSNI